MPPTERNDNGSATVEQDVTAAALVRAARALTHHLDLAGVCDAILDAAEHIFGATSTWLFLADDNGKRLRAVAFRGPGADTFRDIALPSDVGILGLAYTSREMVFVPDVKAEFRWFDPVRVHASGLRSVFTVPLVFQRQAVGVVGLDSARFSAERPPDRTDIERLEALASQAAIAVTNARLYEESEHDRRRLRALLRERDRLRQHVGHLADEVRAAGAFGDILGESPAFTAVLEQARLVAPGDTTALLLGETGTGKELLARFIHEQSARAKGPLVAVNCAALPEALVESELFGHEKGAFTGAVARKIGKFELAHRGSLFLDEIGDLPPEAQAKLLRVLQDGMVQRVGSTAAVAVDVRVIAATNQDLESAIATGAFRADLYYRLSVFPLRIPPLRERLEDIGPLAHYFARRSAARLRRSVGGLTDAAVERLCGYDWPGNVRELQNVIERAVILCRRDLIDADAIGLAPRRPLPSGKAAHETPATFADAERQAILHALEATDWRISGAGGAAVRLGLKPTTLHAKMKKLGIQRPRR